MTKYVANSSPPENCRFAIPKKGRLYEKIAEVLKGAGIKYHREDRLDVALCKDLPLTLIFLPAADIAKYVGEGNVDIGITGIDICEESEVKVERVLDLGFGKCKLCVQAQVSKNIQDPLEVAGGRIVTSFPNLTKKFFDPLDAQKGVTTQINRVSGSVEAACGLGLADAVVDLVETGTTMRAAGLDVVCDVLETEVRLPPLPVLLWPFNHFCKLNFHPDASLLSPIIQAVMIKNPNSEHSDLADLIRKRIEGYITATKFVMLSYNVPAVLLEAACKVTPGKRSPTVTGLDDPEYKAVSALVDKKQLSAVMDKLCDVGATDILAVNLSNSRM
jgi:ATP phosphoribosyltransferase